MRSLTNPSSHLALAARARELEAQIRQGKSGLTRAELKLLPVLHAYAEYYSRFGKTYHVQLQLESVAFKGKEIQGPGAIVQAMFMAELKNMLLTAGHDLDAIKGDVTADVADGSETYRMLGGENQTLKADDMFIRDETGVLSSVVYGPDDRTQITPDTRAVLFTIYAPRGVASLDLDAHLTDLESNVRLFSGNAEVALREILPAE